MMGGVQVGESVRVCGVSVYHSLGRAECRPAGRRRFGAGGLFSQVAPSDQGCPDRSLPENCRARRLGGRRRAGPWTYRRRKGFEVKKNVP